ncbi:uncharacterized protein GGS22DRAFT_190486 [Annulohypoxylon maeteangense]|uniref:uncharacterized protein n=1 Tax=Annulohypoxylon maeteangense TaxID=1927788 RepID=UPI002008A9F2|nr:uncharacterized protein GGS22DRAFT_190486 [Annulohypoxylon maeteangense]KAI0883173.1 hypothetical protein GGS22DRAFT_190486 [Annulohypoxylon maeteangense]
MNALQRICPVHGDGIAFIRDPPRPFLPRGSFRSLIRWMYFSWVFGAVSVGVVTFFHITGLVYPNHGVFSIIPKLIAESDEPVVRFKAIVVVMQVLVYLRSVIVTTPSFIGCLNISRPQPIFRTWVGAFLHSASAVATFVMSMQILPGAWFLSVKLATQEHDYMLQLQGKAVPVARFVSATVIAVFMLNQIICAYLMAIISFAQIMRARNVTGFEIIGVVVLGYLVLPRAYVNQ